MISILTKILSWILSLTSTGVIALMEPPKPPEIPDTPDTLTQEIKVMSFNVYYTNVKARRNGVMQTILAEKPDSFGLQEALEAWRIPLWWELRKEYGMAACKGRYYGLQEATPIFYRKDKYRLLKQGVFWLSDRPKITSLGWDAGLPRVAGYAVLQDKQTGFTYVHFNSHFDNSGPIARANSARMIADRINEMGLPAVFTADVNASPGSLPLEYLQTGGLKDLRDEADVTDTGPTFHGYNNSTAVIDYVMANQYLRKSSEFKVIRDQYDGMYPSDHFAVTAALTLANK